LFLVTNCIISCSAQASDYYFCIVYRMSQVRGGASWTYIDHSVLRCDDGYVSSVAVYESQTATQAAHTPNSSYHNTTDKSVVVTLLQSLHSTLKKNTYVITMQHRMVYTCSTSTTPYFAQTINNTEIIIRSLCIAANYTICD